MRGRRIYSSVIANGLSRIGIGLLNIVVVPLYMNYLGMEAYGLVGFFLVVQGLIVVFDLGISAALTRSLSNYSVKPSLADESRSLAKSLELFYWSVSALIGMVLAVAAPIFAANWIKPVTLTQHTIYLALFFMAAAILFQFPINFYTAGLVGLQKQVEQSVLNFAIWLLRALGAVPFMLALQDRLIAYFIWQASVSALAALLIRYVFWRYMPFCETKARPDFSLFKKVWKFALSVSVVTTSLLLFNNVDKIFLSGRIDLAHYGYYVAAWQIASVLYLFYMPVYTAFYPVLVQFHAAKDDDAFLWAVFRSSLIISSVVVPTVVLLYFFAPQVLQLWTHKADVSAEASPYLRAFLPGALAGALFYVAWAAAQAQDRVSALVKYPLAGLALFTLLVPLAFAFYNAAGVALFWSFSSFVLNMLMSFAALRVNLKAQIWKWVASTMLLPVLGCSAVAYAATLLGLSAFSPFALLFCLVVLWLALVGATYYISLLRKPCAVSCISHGDR